MPRRSKILLESFSLGFYLLQIGDDRFLIIYKKTVTPFVPTSKNSIRLEISDSSIEKIAQLLEIDPVSDAERQNTIFRPSDNKSQAHLPFMFGDFKTKSKVTVPPMNRDTAQRYTSVRQSLPIFEHRTEILNAINQHQVVVISGETGKCCNDLAEPFACAQFEFKRNQIVFCFYGIGLRIWKNNTSSAIYYGRMLSVEPGMPNHLYTATPFGCHINCHSHFRRAK